MTTSSKNKNPNFRKPPKLKIDDFVAASEDRIEKTILQSEMATSKSTSLFSTFMNILPNPEPILADNSKRYEIYDEILNDSFIQGVTGTWIEEAIELTKDEWVKLEGLIL